MTEPSRLRVMHVITGLGVGGAESMLTSMLIHRGQQNLQNSVVSLTPRGANADRLREANVDVSDLGMIRSWPSVSAVMNLARRIRTWQPHVVQSWMYHADFMAAAGLAASARRRRTRLVWGVRCSDMRAEFYGRRLRHLISLCARLSSYPDAVIANSYAGRNIHVQYGYRTDRIEVIPNGYDTARFRPDTLARARIRISLGISQDTPLIAHVARIDPMKDHATFLAALDRLDNVHAVAVGDRTQNLPDHPRLHRLGRRGDVAEILTAADMIISTSAFGEGFSNALAEGMSAGLPAVATDVGDARRIVGDTGIVIPPRDTSALVKAIRSLLDEPEARHRARGASARNRIEQNFSLDSVTQQYAQLYRELTSTCAASPAS